jgi:release factor glutamine methyltransferase
VDRSDAALGFARRNAERLGLASRVDLRLGDWGDGLAGRFDLILCNPPYIAHGADLPPDVSAFEPHGALFAGPDGLADYRRLALVLPLLLACDGIACLEVGEGQAGPVAAMLADAPFTISSRADLKGIERCLVLRA